MRFASLTFLLVAVLLAAAACATPRLQVADPSILLHGDLSFLSDGATTLEEVLLKLGEPSARFECDRILTYPIRADAAGDWHLGTLPPAPSGEFREWSSGTGSLVLVFGADVVLKRHSLVVPK